MKRSWGQYQKDEADKPEPEKFFKPEKKPNKPATLSNLDIDRAERKVWLVKLPTFLANEWDKVTDDDIELGRIKVVNTPASLSGLERPKISLKVTPPSRVKDEDEDEIDEEEAHARMNKKPSAGDVPEEYTLEMADQYANEESAFVVFSYAHEKGRASMEGRVTRRCNLKPVRNTSYHSILSRRHKLANKKSKKIEDISLEDINKTAVSASSNGWIQLGPGRRHKDQLYLTEKKEKMAADELETHLFRCFQQQPYWSVKDLEAATGQPASHVREIVRGICNYTTSGTHRGMYYLKTEYHPYLSKEKLRPKVEPKAEDEDDDAWEPAAKTK